MTPLFALGLAYAQFWYFIPLLIVSSLVYGATRHELPGPIIGHSWRTALWTLAFMGVIFAAIVFLEWFII